MYGRSRSRDLCVAWLRAGAQKWNSSTFLGGESSLPNQRRAGERGAKRSQISLLTHQISLVNYRICLPDTRLIPFFWPDFGRL